jgi:hypothetical protein
MPKVNEEDFVPPHRHRTFTNYIVLSDGKTFDVFADCTQIEVPDDIDDIAGYIRDRMTIFNHPTFKWDAGKNE